VKYGHKLLVLFTLAVVAVTAIVGIVVSASSRQAFEQLDSERTAALVAQFRREFDRRGENLSRRVDTLAARDSIVRIAADLARTPANASLYYQEAGTDAAALQLDFLEIVASDGTIISSAQWPARFGYKDDLVSEQTDWNSQRAFLRREELPNGAALALLAVRVVHVGDSVLYLVGGERLDREFLGSLVLPADTRALLYRNDGPQFSPAALTSASGKVPDPVKLAGIVRLVQRDVAERSEVIEWSDQPASAETVHAIPLTGRAKELLAILLVASSRREIVMLERHIRSTTLIVGGAGIVLGVLLSGWAAARVTQPLETLSDAAREVGEGNWWVQVPVTSSDEFGQLGTAFNRMTHELGEQRRKLVQAERVAAWRELARRLAHELKNPLFPLQITIENLVRCRDGAPDQFDEVFQESTRTLLAELSNLKAIIGRFSDFAKMPAPQPQSISVNDLVKDTIRFLEPQLRAPDRPPIQTQLELSAPVPQIQADPELLRRALQNLVLNAVDAMPSGGTLTLRTEATAHSVQVSVSDTGSGLTPEECERLFTPYYTTKQHGTGLGLAIVQSIVSDHGGNIAVQSESGRGATFTVTLPLQIPEDRRARGANV
jgi:two-component system, NtrC family, nitrogen regulation sensor histidine kinase NtrY